MNHLSARIHGRFARAREEGSFAILRDGLDLLMGALLWIALLPATLLLHALGYRRLPILGERIGHLAAEVDCFLKSRALGELPERKYFLALDPERIANPHLLGYWERRVACVTGWRGALARSMSRWLLLRHEVAQYVLRLNSSADAYRIAARWADREPILSLTDEDLGWGERLLGELGVPQGRWFVAVHVRDAGYSPHDEAVHAHRNSSIEALGEAVRLIVARGGLCLRIGDARSVRAPAWPGLIDYAHHPLRSARGDVYLSARCRFFLGDSSGLAFVSAAFGVPSALANLIPFSTLGLLPTDLGIPKLMRSVRDGRVLRFAEVLDAPLANFRYARLYRDAGVSAVENDAEDIRALVEEMLDRLDGRFVPAAEDEALQRAHRALLRPGHYSFGSPARVGAAFLRRHRALLPAAL